MPTHVLNLLIRVLRLTVSKQLTDARVKGLNSYLHSISFYVLKFHLNFSRVNLAESYLKCCEQFKLLVVGWPPLFIMFWTWRQFWNFPKIKRGWIMASLKYEGTQPEVKVKALITSSLVAWKTFLNSEVGKMKVIGHKSIILDFLSLLFLFSRCTTASIQQCGD